MNQNGLPLSFKRKKEWKEGRKHVYLDANERKLKINIQNLT
jgi:hypothetical protein